MAEEKRKVWTQICEVGSYKGHRMGPFELNPGLFSQIVTNFHRGKLPIPIDAEHASEQPPTEGNIPSQGAPAMGWIHELDNRGGRGLWGLVEWLEPARTYIKEGRYRYLSPAIRFGEKDSVTGDPIGARLSSAAITNTPYLRNMEPLHASARSGAGGEAVTFSILQKMTVEEIAGAVTPSVLALRSSLAHQPHEYMPRIKAALKLPELSTAVECSDHLERLADMCALDMDGDADGQHEGVDLGSYTRPLRDMVCGNTMGSTMDDVFDVVREMIRSAIGEHEIVDHGGLSEDALSLDEDGGDEGDMGGGGADLHLSTNNPKKDETDMSTDKIKELEGEKAVLLSEKGALSTEKATLLSQNTALITDKAKLELSLTEAKGKLDEQAKELDTLRADKTAREERDLQLKVDVAYATYKDKKHLTEASKKTMLIVLKADAAGFDAEYPPVSAEHRHLMSLKTTGPNQRPAAPVVPGGGNGAPLKVSKLELSKQLAAKRGITLGDAMLLVDDVARVTAK